MTSSKPRLLSAAVGSTFGFRLGEKFFLGVSSEYRNIQQISDTRSENASGSRWNSFAPTLGIRSSRFLIKANYQFLGNYNLKRRSLNGEKISYEKPRGWGILAMTRIGGRFYFGPFYEGISFKQQSVGVVNTELTTPLKLWQAGLSLTWAP